MTDYIKREDAIRSIADHDEFKGERWIKEAWADYLIEDAKSADVVPVVRCKDCEWQDKGENESESWNMCMYRPWSYKQIEDTDFCSDGKRRDDE